MAHKRGIIKLPNYEYHTKGSPTPRQLQTCLKITNKKDTAEKKKKNAFMIFVTRKLSRTFYIFYLVYSIWPSLIPTSKSKESTMTRSLKDGCNVKGQT